MIVQIDNSKCMLWNDQSKNEGLSATSQLLLLLIKDQKDKGEEENVFSRRCF